MAIIPFIIMGLAVLIFIFAMYRSDWVHDQHIRVIRKVGDEGKEFIRLSRERGDEETLNSFSPTEWYRVHYDEAYWSSDKMMLPWYWHIWDIEKMRNYPALPIEVKEVAETEEEWPELIGG